MHFDESFVIALAFTIFIVLVAKPVFSLVTRGLDKRSDGIKDELEEAMQLKEEAQALLASYQRKQKKSMEEAEEIIAHAKLEADRIVKDAKKRVEEDIAKRTELALQKIAQAEANVFQEIRENAVDITVSAARTLIAENLSKEAAEVLVSKAIHDIDQKFH